MSTLTNHTKDGIKAALHKRMSKGKFTFPELQEIVVRSFPHPDSWKIADRYIQMLLNSGGITGPDKNGYYKA